LRKTSIHPSQPETNTKLFEVDNTHVPNLLEILIVFKDKL